MHSAYPQGDPAQTYRHWATVEARGRSQIYERLVLAMSKDHDLMQLVATLPQGKQQPNLLLATMRWYSVDVEDPAVAITWARENWPKAKEMIERRRTQTNEVSRCAALLLALSRFRGPIALVEVGAAAGLCLLVDRWSYRYRELTEDGTRKTKRIGTGAPLTIECTLSGPVKVPNTPPRIVWRGGLDLHPVNPRDPDARRWMHCLIWPEHHQRRAILDDALDEAARQRPRIIAGDLLEDLDELLDRVPGEATTVVMHSATLAYESPQRRAQFLELLTERGLHRVGLESAHVVQGLDRELPSSVTDGRLVLSLDRQLLATVQPHGTDIAWLAS